MLVWLHRISIKHIWIILELGIKKAIKHMEKKTKIIIRKIILGLAVYLLVDYIILPSVIGFMPTNINIDMFGILLDTAVVSILYVISFYYIDNKQNIKDANAKDAVNSLLEKTYQECLDNLKILDDKKLIAEHIIPKVDGNRPASENKVINNLQELPFSSFDSVIDLAANGYVEKDKFDKYLNIKKDYQYLINVKIIFFDLIEPETDEQRAMYNDILSRDAKLKIELKKCVIEINS
jgi:hypothetical protein